MQFEAEALGFQRADEALIDRLLCPILPILFVYPLDLCRLGTRAGLLVLRLPAARAGKKGGRNGGTAGMRFMAALYSVTSFCSSLC